MSFSSHDVSLFLLIVEPDTQTSRPSCFERPPARGDAYYHYNEFEAFCLPASKLNKAWELHLPRELVGHDVSEEDWCVFIHGVADPTAGGRTR